MKVKIEKKKSLIIAGIDRANINSSPQCVKLWEEFTSKYSDEEIASLGNAESVGICHDMKKDGKFSYMAGYIITNESKAKEMNLDILKTKEREYLIVYIQGKVPECIHKGWEYMTKTYFPNEGYKHSGEPDIEFYYKGDMKKDDYKMELWIPFIKVK